MIKHLPETKRNKNILQIVYDATVKALGKDDPIAKESGRIEKVFTKISNIFKCLYICMSTHK